MNSNYQHPSYFKGTHNTYLLNFIFFLPLCLRFNVKFYHTKNFHTTVTLYLIASKPSNKRPSCSATHICYRHLIPVPGVGLDDPCGSLTIWDILWLFKKMGMNHGFLFTVCLRSQISKRSKRLVLLTGKKSLNLTFFFKPSTTHHNHRQRNEPSVVINNSESKALPMN